MNIIIDMYGHNKLVNLKWSCFRLGEDWKKARSAVNNQIKSSNVQMHTAGQNEVFGSFIDYLQSTKDRDGRISDVSWPLKRLIVACKYIIITLLLHVWEGNMGNYFSSRVA